MDRLERINDPVGSLVGALTGWQADIWTAMPGVLVSFDAQDTTCSVQITVQMQVQRPDGTFYWDTIKPLVKCPLVLPGGGGLVITLPMKAGDEVLVVFASRCIDAWWQSGKVGPQVELRMHDLSDGFAIPGPRSVPNAIPNYNANAMELRTEDGNLAISIDPTTSKIKFKGDVEFLGNVSMAQNLGVAGTLSNDGVNVGKTHRHSTSTNPSGTPI